jgi:hypothetical protein
LLLIGDDLKLLKLLVEFFDCSFLTRTEILKSRNEYLLTPVMVPLPYDDVLQSGDGAVGSLTGVSVDGIF